jgi:lysophospholipase L1-like esterase
MRNRTVLMILMALVYFSAYAQSNQPFWKDIQAFKKKDSISAPAKGGIVFIGSSSFTRWAQLETVYKSYGAINRGFGGSTLVDANNYVKDIVEPYKPRQVVIYSGENDVAGGASALETLNRFAALFSNIRHALPNVPLVYVSMKQSPSRVGVAQTVVHANALIKEYLTHYGATAFVDVDSPMHNPDGSLQPELFVEDRLHMNPAGYAIWIKALTPYLLKK